MGILDKEPGSNGKEKLIWHDLPNKYDSPVKSINQLSSRLSEIFPKIQVCRYLEREEIERRHQRYLLGVGFVQSSVKTVKTSAPSAPKSALVDTARVSSVLASAPESVPKNIGANVGADSDILKNVTQRDLQGFGADGADDFSHFAEVCKLVSKFTDVERQKLIEFLTQSQPLPQKITPEDAQKMRDIALVWWPEYYPEQMQALLTQMYAWQAPGTKYNVAIIAEWLQGEDDLIRDRITELMHRRRD
jgi:hypothetical protein